jgi:hypothetical protein
MNRFVIALAMSAVFAVSAAALNAQQTPPPARPTPPPVAATAPAGQDVMLTGCLVQGSGPTVFIFDNAKADPAIKESGDSFLVISGTEDLNLRAHLNHKVQIGGRAEGKRVPSNGQAPDEKLLPTLTATSLTMVANTCAS